MNDSIRIKTFSNQYYDITRAPYQPTTVRWLKTQLEAETGWPLEVIYLVHRGQVLPEETVVDSDITQLYVTLRPRNCECHIDQTSVGHTCTKCSKSASEK